MIYIAWIVLIDPFNYFYLVSVAGNRKKIENYRFVPELSMLGTMVWKLSEYNRSRCKNIILGDSRVVGMSSDTIKKMTGLQFYNFGTPGGDCGTYINLFWYANERVRLKNVYIAVSFHNYGVSWRRDLFEEAMRIRHTVYPLFTEGPFIRQTAEITKAAIARHKIRIPRTDPMGTQIPHGKESFVERSPEMQQTWDSKVKEQQTTFKLYKYPNDYLNGLRHIALYCAQHNIRLVFFIPPNYREVHDLARAAYLEGAYNRFKQDIRSLGETYDFDYPSDITENKDYYYDIVHFNWVVYDILYREVWNHEKGIARHTFPYDNIRLN
jgi:hypothetical protein